MGAPIAAPSSGARKHYRSAIVRALLGRHGTGWRAAEDDPQIRDQNVTKYAHVSMSEPGLLAL